MPTPAPPEEKLDAGSRVLGAFMAAAAQVVILLAATALIYFGAPRNNWAAGTFVSMFGTMPLSALAGAVLGPDKVKWCIRHLFLLARPVRIHTTVALWLALSAMAIAGFFLFVSTIRISF